MSRLHTIQAEIGPVQHGLLHRQQLLARGVTPGQIAAAVRSGRLVTEHPSVHRVPGAPVSRASVILAAVLAVRPSEEGEDIASAAAAARATAAELHDLRGTPRSGRIHVVVSHQRRLSLAAGNVIIHRSRTLAPDHVILVEGIPTTAVPRTLCDLAIDNAPRQLREAVADALRRRLTSLPELDMQLANAGNIVGRATLRRVLRSLGPTDARARSLLESRALEIIRDAGLAEPEVNWVLREGDRVIAELDLAWPATRVAVEIDGYWWHSTPHQKARDEARQNALVARGWRIVRAGEDLLMNHPEQFVRSVERTLLASLASA